MIQYLRTWAPFILGVAIGLTALLVTALLLLGTRETAPFVYSFV